MDFIYLENSLTKTVKLQNDAVIPRHHGDTLLDLKVSVQAGNQKEMFLFQNSKIITFYKGIPNENLEILVTANSIVKEIDPIINIYGTFGFTVKPKLKKKNSFLEFFVKLFR